jgi:hypothetical protein
MGLSAGRLLHERLWVVHRRGAMGLDSTIAQVGHNLIQSALNSDLGRADISDMSLKASYSPSDMSLQALDASWCTHSSPASPVRLASLVGFSNRHSRPA